MKQLADTSLILGRWCIATLFIAGLVQKWVAPEVVEAMLRNSGLPARLIWPALVLNGVGALCLITGLWLAPVAFILAVYCLLTSYFHFIPDDPWQMSIFVKNWAIAGGLFVLFAYQLERNDG